MTAPIPPGAPPARVEGQPSLDRDTAERVSLGLIRVMKLMQALRQHAPRQHPAVDTAAYPVLFTLAAEPQRVSTLAELVHSDVSTVSRQVSTLAAHGLLEKVSDPDDGRAQVVRLSTEGEALVARIQHTRNEWFATLLADWDHADAADFADHLERFGATLLELRTSHTSPTSTSPTPASPAPTSPAPISHSTEN